jgi:3-oxoacyl-[acyl-carrier protein] reductase
MILQGQSALITGSGRGIGRAIALLFAKEGASVFLCARSHDQLASTAAEISDGGGQAAFATADVTGEDDCRRIVNGAREKFGPVTILVNNAGHWCPAINRRESAV